jgi:hypothetical protein
VHLPIPAPTFIFLIISPEKSTRSKISARSSRPPTSGWKVYTVVFLERTRPRRRLAINHAGKCVNREVRSLRPKDAIPELETLMYVHCTVDEIRNTNSKRGRCPKPRSLGGFGMYCSPTLVEMFCEKEHLRFPTLRPRTPQSRGSGNVPKATAGQSNVSWARKRNC